MFELEKPTESLQHTSLDKDAKHFPTVYNTSKTLLDRPVKMPQKKRKRRMLEVFLTAKNLLGKILRWFEGVDCDPC